MDLSDIVGRIEKLKDDHAGVQQKLADIRKYTPTKGTPDDALVKMAKLGYVVDDWMRETDVRISAVQCWTAMEQYLGVAPCAVMSMMSNEMTSSACEVDICGAIAMHALAQASGTPSALLDWNNNYGQDPNKAVCFHCSNCPKHFFDSTRMDYQEILAGTVGKANSFGTIVGRVKAGTMSYARFPLTTSRAGYAATWETAPSRATRSRLSEASASWISPVCNGCCIIFAKTGLSTMSPPTCRVPPQPCTKPRRDTWVGTCIGTGMPRNRTWTAFR